MSLPVHLVESLDGVTPGSVVEVTGDEAHHAVAVRRLREGEQVVLTDGRGTSVTGSVDSTGKRVFSVTVASVTQDPRPEPAITVVQALPKGDRGELAVEVLTEVGVDRIVPWAASRSVAVWKGERATKSHAKWQATAREAAKQSRRSWLPTVTPLASTADLATLVAEADLACSWWGRRAGSAPTSSRCWATPAPTPYASARRCSARRPPVSSPSPPCWPAPAAGPDPARPADRGYCTVTVFVSTAGPLPSAPPDGSSVSHCTTTSPETSPSGRSTSNGKSRSSIQASVW
jgi:16S rRNA U1498 N3-methylase RsmE